MNFKLIAPILVSHILGIDSKYLQIPNLIKISTNSYLQRSLTGLYSLSLSF